MSHLNLIFCRYPLLPYLLTPVKNPGNRGEERYNSRHKRGRCVVEQTFGVAKMRFMCLNKAGGCLMYTPERCVKIILSCLILHNICIANNLPEPEAVVNRDADDNVEDEDAEARQFDQEDGIAVRNELINVRFAN